MKMPKIYDDPRKFSEFSRMLSSYILWGVDSKEIVKFFQSAFANEFYSSGIGKCSRYSEREMLEIGALCVMTIERESSEIAGELAKIFNFGKPAPGRSYNELLYEVYFSEGWDKSDMPSRICAQALVNMPQWKCKRSNPAASSTDRKYVMTLNADDGLYLYRRKNGRLVVAAINETENKSTLIDEESFNGDAPLYFTESSHFTSPMFTVNVMSNILEWTLSRFSYLNIGIDSCVVFTRPNFELLNIDDFKENPDYTNTWGRTHVILKSDNSTSKYLLTDIAPMTATVDEGLKKQDTILYGAIGATILLYASLKTKFRDFNLLIERNKGEQPAYCDLLEKEARALRCICPI